MKTGRSVAIVLGWLFIFIQVVSYIGPLLKHQPVFDENDTAYLVGRNLFGFLGIVFLIIAKRQKTRIRKREDRKQLDAFLDQ